MPSVPTIDIDAILKPISGEKPCGADPRDGKSFELLKEARREEDPDPQGEWQRDVKVADWPKAIQFAITVLSTEGKELQIAVWLAEGLVKKHGTAGLRDGLKILSGLHEQYWDFFYPVIEDGDVEYRTGRLEALAKNLPIAINNVPLILPPGGPAYCYRHYKESQEVENLRRGAATDAKKRGQLAEALEEKKLEGEKFEKAVAATPLTHCSTILDNLNQCWDECQHLKQIVDEKYGQDAPNLGSISEAVGECRSFMGQVVRKKGGVAPVAAIEPEPAPRGASMIAATQVMTGSGIMPIDRADALRRLAAVADFFHRTEPHSPVAYLVQRAARWGDMPLEEWLREVIKSEDVLGNVRETLGLNQNQQASGESK